MRGLGNGAPHDLLGNPADDFVAALMATPKRQADRLEALAAAHANGEPGASATGGQQ